jgi:hypothetical protein
MNDTENESGRGVLGNGHINSCRAEMAAATGTPTRTQTAVAIATPLIEPKIVISGPSFLAFDSVKICVHQLKLRAVALDNIHDGVFAQSEPMVTSGYDRPSSRRSFQYQIAKLAYTLPDGRGSEAPSEPRGFSKGRSEIRKTNFRKLLLALNLPLIAVLPLTA